MSMVFNRSTSLFAIIGAAMMGSAGRALPSFKGVLDSIRTGTALREKANLRGCNSVVWRCHNAVVRRSWSRYPMPVAPGDQPQAMARRRRQMGLE